jgi:hypothetical protein
MKGRIVKSMLGSGWDAVKDKLGRKQDEPALASPLGLRIGAAAEIDVIPFRMLGDALKLQVPEETLIVEAQGFVDLGNGTTAHRYYAADHTMLQVLTVDGLSDEHVQEITLYRPFDSFYPETSTQWAVWIGDGGRIGAPAFHLDSGQSYSRIWFDNEEGGVSPVAFSEDVYESPESEPTVIYQRVMLYGRPLENEKAEYLLAAAERTSEGETVELMLGVDINRTGLTVL